MARILFGVMGDALGHVNRARILAQEMTMHEFLFLGGGKVLNLRAEGYRVESIPMLSTHYANHKIDIPATLHNGVRVLSGWNRILKKVGRIITDFNPDIVLTDYEVFVPIAARRLGIPCISIDHQHFMTKCRFPPPRGQIPGRLMLNLSIRLFYSNAQHYLITSFFRLPTINPADSEIFPPMIRREVKEMIPKAGDHVLVYQTSPTFHRLLPILEQMPGQYVIYGSDRRPGSKNTVFKSPSTRGFLEDLASCRYAITNAGHNVISEALFLGKPVFAFPIHLAYEQFFNGYMLKKMGYGDYSLTPDPDVKLFMDFETNLDFYQKQIASGNFWGTEDMVRKIDALILNP